MPESDDSLSLTVEVVRQTLALYNRDDTSLRVEIADYSEAFLELTVRSSTGGSVTLLFIQGEALPSRFEVAASGVARSDGDRLQHVMKEHNMDFSLRTLGDFFVLNGPDCEALITTTDGRPVWTRQHRMGKTAVYIGTALSSDLLRFRQGVEENVHSHGRTESLYGFPNERPVYLYEGVVNPNMPYERQADWWSMLLVESLRGDVSPESEKSSRKPVRYLVVTGDDDQADLETYDKQQRILHGLPITYFLHPRTRHAKSSLRRLCRVNPDIEFGLHPDALDNPTSYEALFSGQVDWFKRLTGTTPLSVRNHGFLNDGYWNHLRSWLAHGVKASSNIPGLDGRILTNSLIPFPLVLDSKVTNHWSIITSFGDGMIFALGMSDKEASDRVKSFASRMASDSIDGTLVINLHPQNVDRARMLHHTTRDLVDDGFVPVTLSSLIRIYETPGEQPAWKRRFPFGRSRSRQR